MDTNVIRADQEFETPAEGEDGWCDWQSPMHAKYMMKCCDCGLVHEAQFRVVKIVARGDDGTWDANAVEDKDVRVQLRMRRS